MGMDIHLYVVKDSEVLADNFFNGRNSEWFNNLMDRGYDECYGYLPTNSGISPQSPKTEDFDIEKLKYYFGFNYISVKKFKEWFLKYRPDMDAGWVSTYDKWNYETRGIVPELQHYLDEDDNIHDMHFIEIVNPYDCSGWLYQYLLENDMPDDADITYWFDN